MSFTVERVTQVVLGARQEVEKGKISRNVEEWKADMISKELDSLASILKALIACTDISTTQAVLKLIFVRAKDIWTTFKNEQQDKGHTTTPPTSPTNVSGGINTLIKTSSVIHQHYEKEGEKESAEDRRKREEADRKAKEEKEFRDRTARIKKEREDREKEQAKIREEQQAKERLARLEKEKQEEREREQRRQQLEREKKEKEAKKKKKDKKKDKKDKKDKNNNKNNNNNERTLPTLNTTITKVVVEEDLGLTDSPLKDRKHQEWDSEIRRLNNVVNEKIINMEKRRSRRNLVAGSMMIPNPRTQHTQRIDSVFLPPMAKSTPAITTTTPTTTTTTTTTTTHTTPKQQQQQPSITNSRIAAAASIFEKQQQQQPSLKSPERARPQTMLIRPSADSSRPSASSLAAQLDGGNKAKVTEGIQKAGKEATTAAQLLLKKEATDTAALNSAIRMMVINFKSCTEFIDVSTQKKLKDDILDVCMCVLLKTKEYLTDPNDQTKKGLLVKEIARALTIIKDYNQHA